MKIGDCLVYRSDGNPVYQGRDAREKAALDSLQWYVKDRVLNILLEMRREGFDPYCNQGKRRPAQQIANVKKGVSWTLFSKHLVGKAADIIDAKLGWGASKAFWAALAAACRHQGMFWGGLWPKLIDKAHVEWQNGRIA